eukprot:2973368-Prymnesium_polylepis.2
MSAANTFQNSSSSRNHSARTDHAPASLWAPWAPPTMPASGHHDEQPVVSGHANKLADHLHVAQTREAAVEGVEETVWSLAACATSRRRLYDRIERQRHAQGVKPVLSQEGHVAIERRLG